MMRTLALLLILILLAPVGCAQGGSEAALDVNARRLSVVAFHPVPDPQGDPWGLPYAARNNTTYDYVRYTYGATLYPTAVFDGLHVLEGATSFTPTINAYEETYKDRSRHDAPLRLSMMAAAPTDVLNITINVRAKTTLESSRLVLHAVLIEDDVAFKGGNGVDNHRFVARVHATPMTLALDAQGNQTTLVTFPLQPAWGTDRLGVVAWVVNDDAGSRAFKEREVLQAATYLVRQQGPTIQASKGVLIQFYTATWCPTCVYGDAAIDELANFYGVTSLRIEARAFEYLRPIGPAVWFAALMVGILAALLVGMRRRPSA
jgi:hypothetical protein